MDEKKAPYLIVGLGNPGSEYALTRHNIGFMIADKLAERNGIALKKEASLKGMIGKGKIVDTDFFLLKPCTFMNNSGEAVVLVQRYFQIPIHQILVISDEVALPFGKMRLSDKGSCGGHRGLESVELKLGTLHYARLRFGIDDREHGELADYVLEKFSDPEFAELPILIERAAEGVETWMNKGSEAARRILLPKQNLKES